MILFLPINVTEKRKQSILRDGFILVNGNIRLHLKMYWLRFKKEHSRPHWFSCWPLCNLFKRWINSLSFPARGSQFGGWNTWKVWKNNQYWAKSAILLLQSLLNFCTSLSTSHSSKVTLICTTPQMNFFVTPSLLLFSVYLYSHFPKKGESSLDHFHLTQSTGSH